MASFCLQYSINEVATSQNKWLLASAYITVTTKGSYAWHKYQLTSVHSIALPKCLQT